MSDQFEPQFESSRYVPGESAERKNISPLLLGCGALLLGLAGLGILAAVTAVIVAVYPHATRNYRPPIIAAQPMPAAPSEPAGAGRVSRSPRSAAQRQENARLMIELAERASAADPDNPMLLNNLAWAYATAPEELQDAKQAVTLAERAVTLEPGNQNYINTLGTAYYRAGRYDEAVSMLERNAGARTDPSVGFDLYPLAMAYWALERKDEASKTYERARECHRRHEDSLALNHWHELYEFRLEAATLLLGESPQQVFERAGELARKGEWEPAAALFAKGLDVYPDDHWQWYRSGALQAYLNHAEEYTAHCRQMLELFGSTQDPAIAERTSKLCLLLPAAAPNDARPAQLAERAAGLRPDSAWFRLAAAIAKYRAAQFAEALDQLQRAEAQAGSQTYCQVLIELFRAMSQHQLGQPDAAQGSLDRASALLKPTAPQTQDEGVDYGPAWHDYLIGEVILREATTLIRREDTVPSQPSKESVPKTG